MTHRGCIAQLRQGGRDAVLLLGGRCRPNHPPLQLRDEGCHRRCWDHAWPLPQGRGETPTPCRASMLVSPRLYSLLLCCCILASSTVTTLHLLIQLDSLALLETAATLPAFTLGGTTDKAARTNRSIVVYIRRGEDPHLVTAALEEADWSSSKALQQAAAGALRLPAVAAGAPFLDSRWAARRLPASASGTASC